MTSLARYATFAVPLVGGFVVVAALPRTKEPRLDAQDLRSDGGGAGGADEPGSGPAGDDGADPPGLPERGLPASLDVPAAGPPRSLDRAKLEGRARWKSKATLRPEAVRDAIAFDDEAWKGDPRSDLLAFLRGGAANGSSTFTEADVRVVARIQAGSGSSVDGKVDEATLAVLFAAGFRFAAPKKKTTNAELEFFPGELEDLDAWKREIDEKLTKRGGGFRDIVPPRGEGRIYVRVGGKIVAGYRARGGPPATIVDDTGHTAEPTKPGTYKLGPAHVHVTSNWYNSQMPWGAEIRKVQGGFQYRWPLGAGWSWATAHPSNKLREPFDPDDFDDLPEASRDGETFWVWNKNDFGPFAWNLVPGDLYLHTTPDAETSNEAEIELSISHGCVHVIPRERDEMVERGYLRKDARFVVHELEDHILPVRARRYMLEDE